MLTLCGPYAGGAGAVVGFSFVETSDGIIWYAAGKSGMLSIILSWIISPIFAGSVVRPCQRSHTVTWVVCHTIVWVKYIGLASPIFAGSVHVQTCKRSHPRAKHIPKHDRTLFQNGANNRVLGCVLHLSNLPVLAAKHVSNQGSIRFNR